MEGLDQGLVVMLEGRGGREVAMLRGRKGSRRRHQGERMGQQVPEQVLESSGSKESWLHQKLRSGADQGWQCGRSGCW